MIDIYIDNENAELTSGQNKYILSMIQDTGIQDELTNNDKINATIHTFQKDNEIALYGSNPEYLFPSTSYYYYHKKYPVDFIDNTKEYFIIDKHETDELIFMLDTQKPVFLKYNNQWFQDYFKPYVHYVPLDDFNTHRDIDLWITQNNKLFHEIGKNGYGFIIKFLNLDKIYNQIKSCLMKKISHRESQLEIIFQRIKKDINQFNYYPNTLTRLELAIKTTFKLDENVLVVEIKDNKMKIIHEVKGFERRSEGIKKIIQMALDYGKIIDTVLYLHVGDEYVYQFPELPFCVIAKPLDKTGILMVDNTFVDVEPEVRTIGTTDKMTGWEETRDKIYSRCDDKKDKINKMFFIGQNISLKKTNFNMREYLSKSTKSFLDVRTSGYMHMSQYCDYKYLLNIIGMSPWSFRFKFLFLMKSLVINIAMRRKYNMTYDEKWINIFDSLFKPNKDYIEIEYLENNDLKHIENQLELIFDTFEKDNDLYKMIVDNGYQKSKLIDNTSIAKISHSIFNEYANKIKDAREKEKLDDITREIRRVSKYYKYLKDKQGRIERYNYKLLGSGVQGSVYEIKNNKYTWTVKTTYIRFARYEPYRELYFSDLVKNKRNPFLKYYDCSVINNTCYLSMQRAEDNMIDWCMKSRSVDEWKSFIYQIIIGVLKMQKLNMIHNDLQPKNILYDMRRASIVYKIKDKTYNFQSNYLFYIADFGISVHPELFVNLLSKENIQNKNFDMKRFSRFPKKIRSINIEKKYNYEELLNKLNELENNEYNQKLNNLLKKTKDWWFNTKQDKHEFIHRQMAYYYIKKGYFDETNDYIEQAPAPIPKVIENMFDELREYYLNPNKNLENWLEEKLNNIY